MFQWNPPVVTFALMTTETFSQNVSELFSKLKLVTDNLFIIYILPNHLSPLLSPPLFPPSLLSSPVSPLPPSTCSILKGWCMQVWRSSQRNPQLHQSLLRRMTEWSMLPLHINQKMQQRIARQLLLQHQKQRDTQMQVRVWGVDKQVALFTNLSTTLSYATSDECEWEDQG